MSIQAVAWVLEHSEATLADRLVLLAIANHCDARGWNAWPAVERLAGEARVDRRSVFRAIEALEASGELVIQRRPGRSNMYGIAAFMGCQEVTPKGVAGSHPGVTSTAQRGGRASPKPSVTVKEPGAEVIEYDPDTLEKDADGRWFVRTSKAPPKPVTQNTLPPELPEETRARGAEWARALRNGGDPK